ncbi:guanylyl cyclase-activating protein 2-like [Denticeps clupeoides]|uniref:EF-hand domain-containing protein n=1 Tax=Denticeps clupeoides TaxID=299321 RepID=A0AAY4CI47_9TELE|nr:guanylyl cyclase-activating protein 2-like [Denticeps clupeoides]
MGQSPSQDEDEGVDVSAIQTLYKTFVTQCPSGSLYLHEFKKIFGVGNDDTAESLYMDDLFRSFDMNGDNTLDFIEYVAALHLVLRGKLEDKLRWSFKVFDSDENGRLDRCELKRIIMVIYKIKQGRVSEEPANSSCLTLDQVCDRIFESMDENGDGQISLEEFLDGAQRDPWVRNFLKLDMNPCFWVNGHQKQISGYKKTE